MFKKIRERRYNKKEREFLQNKMFDSFAYCGYSEVPSFNIRATATTNHMRYAPETSDIFYVCVAKLKDEFVKEKSLKDFAEMAKTYCEHYGFNESVFYNAIRMYQNKRAVNKVSDKDYV